MSILFLLIPLGVGMLAVAIGGFFWAVRQRQFDDLQSPAVRILLDEDQIVPPELQQAESQD